MRQWASQNTGPSAPYYQRILSTCIFKAIFPALGKSTGPVLPFCNTDPMILNFAEIVRDVALDI
jgi:hypothetical protein